MNRIVTDKIPQLTELCKKYRVTKMYLFGSAATGAVIRIPYGMCRSVETPVAFRPIPENIFLPSGNA